MSDQNTLRGMLETNLTASADGTLGQVADSAPIDVVEPQDPISDDQRARDEQGRFAAKAAKDVEVKAADDADAVIADPAAVVTVEPVVAPQRPTTWKKEYLPIWDKIAVGAPLTPDESRKLADYSQQREKEYATGVSTYRAEAQNANELRAAVEPFMPILQQHNMKVGDWIKNLGTAHQTLALGTPEQKLQMFATMAQQYGIPLQAVTQASQGQFDPNVTQMMQQIQDLNNKVSSVTGWREQQEAQSLQQQLSEFQDTSKYPHFDLVRGDMAQLLESGMAQDLKSAYGKAVRMNDDAWSAEQERQAPAQVAPAHQISKSEAAAKAKAAAVSPKSVTPSGEVKPVNAGGLRESLAAQFDAVASSRL